MKLVGNFLTRLAPNWSAILSEQSAYTPASRTSTSFRIGDYFDLVRRRILCIVLPTVGISLCIAVVAMRMPNVYRAEATIQASPQKVNENNVPTSVTGSIAGRLSSMRQEVLSPGQLGQVIEESSLYPNLRGKASAQSLIARVQNSITVEVVDESGQRSSTFRVAFTDSDPKQAAKAANRIASLFIEGSLKARQLQFNATFQSLETELQETKRQLEEKERFVQDVKSRYSMDLPESKQYHLDAVNSLKDQLRNSQEQVNRDRQTMLSVQSMPAVPAPRVDLDQQAMKSKSAHQAQLQELESQLKDLQARYGANYPDVRKLRKEIAGLKAKAEAEKPQIEISKPQASPTQDQAHNPVVEAEVNKLDQEIKDQTKIQAQLQGQIDYHAGKLHQIPVFEQQIAGLMRDYDSLRNRYSQLQEKKLSAQTAGEMETYLAGEHFEIIRAAVPPEAPFGPNRGMTTAGGFFFGLLCGIGVAFLVELSDGSVRHTREAARIFGKPVLAGIPLITSPKERALKHLRTVSLTAGTAIAAVGFGILISRFFA